MDRIVVHTAILIEKPNSGDVETAFLKIMYSGLWNDLKPALSLLFWAVQSLHCARGCSFYRSGVFQPTSLKLFRRHNGPQVKQPLRSVMHGLYL